MQKKSEITNDYRLNISAVIPAAGMSTRMHQYKPLLTLGNHTLIEKVIFLFQECGIKDIIVVTGHNCEKIEPLIFNSGAKPVFNPDFKSGMFGSIQTGVRAISPLSSGFFLLPADIPLIRPATIHTLLSSFMESPQKIIVPEFNLESGHPPLIPSWLIPDILSSGDGYLHQNANYASNLGELLLSRQNHQKREKVYDHAILMDADTKADYENLKTKYLTIDIPDRLECQSIINANLEGEETIKFHLDLVADTAIRLAKEVQNKTVQEEAQKKEVQKFNLDIHLIMAGALLHDIKRKEKNHADAGAKLLLSLGFPRVADIVAQHMDISLMSEHLTEAQIVYFADKICNGASLELDYDQRFKEKMAKNPSAASAILRRYENTRLIHSRIEESSGKSVKDMLS